MNRFTAINKFIEKNAIPENRDMQYFTVPFIVREEMDDEDRAELENNWYPDGGSNDYTREVNGVTFSLRVIPQKDL